MAVRTLDGAILVCDTQIVARRCHAVVTHELLIALRQVFRSVAIHVAECRRETIAAMLAWYAAEAPQRVLQSLRQRHIALASKHHMRMFKAREGKPEVVEPMLQHDPCDRQTKTARLVHLPKDHIPLGPSDSTPAAYAALQCAPNVCSDLGMAPTEFFEHCDRPEARRCLQHRYDLIVPKRRQRVRPSSAAGRFLLRGQPWIALNSVAARSAEAGFGG